VSAPFIRGIAAGVGPAAGKTFALTQQTDVCYNAIASREREGVPALRVLGIDPGLGTTGYGVVELVAGAPLIREAGTVRTRRGDALPERLRTLYEGISEVIRDCHPEVIALEDLYTEYQFPRTALLMAHARGAICLAAALQAIRVVSFAPSEVKSAVVGFGRASKEQVQGTVQRVLGLSQPPHPNDVADALALALTGCYREGSPLQARER